MLTLLVLTLLAGSVVPLYLHWTPWFKAWSYTKDYEHIHFTRDGRTAIATRGEDVSVDNRYVTASNCEAVAIDLRTGNEKKLCEWELQNCTHVALSPDGSCAAFVDRRRDGISRVHVLGLNGEPSKSFAIASSSTPPAVTFTADGRSLVTHQLEFRDPGTGVLQFAIGKQDPVLAHLDAPIFRSKVEFALGVETLKEFAEATSQLTVHGLVDPTGHTLLTVILDTGTAQLWDLVTQKKNTWMKISYYGHQRGLENTYHFANNGACALISSYSGVFVVNSRTGEKSRLTPRAFNDGDLWDLGASSRVAMGGNNYFVQVCDLNTFKVHPLNVQFSEQGTSITPDGSRIIDRNVLALDIFDAETGRQLDKIPGNWQNSLVDFAPNGEGILRRTGDSMEIWRQRHPDQWWGVAYLPEFWMTLFFFWLLTWSIRRDRRYFAIPAAQRPPRRLFKRAKALKAG